MYDEEKFKSFNLLLANAAAEEIEVVAIAYPNVLGDNYEELIENLARIADAGLELAIAGRTPGDLSKLKPNLEIVKTVDEDADENDRRKTRGGSTVPGRAPQR